MADEPFPLPNATVELRPQVALVTGATSGLGRQLDSTPLYLVAPSPEFVNGTVVKVDDGQEPR
ncbi:MAG: hypothetical protein ACRDYB_07940 [Acidimicrobiales bacterium]